MRLTTGVRSSRVFGMDFNVALGLVVRRYRHAQELTLRQISASGYVSSGHLSDVEQGRKGCSPSFINGVAKALQVEPYVLVLEAGYLMAASPAPDTPESLFDRASQWTTQYADLISD